MTIQLFLLDSKLQIAKSELLMIAFNLSFYINFMIMIYDLTYNY